MASDFDKQFKGIINTVRSTINPDYAIPKDKQHAPMNVRIQRMKVAAAELSNKIKELNKNFYSMINPQLLNLRTRNPIRVW